ncbi:MAG: FHA domain-containing protein [Armatimonadetes bacterium]|nr:FHA domain-containing protein [Armatimonadota bacterium]MDW8153097.1 DUF3662 and FHA domain-containing protein [Armatimonadota bacterium]
MALLERWEARLEALVEGLLFRTGGRVQPVEVARQLLRAMDRHHTVSVLRVYAPNEFEVALPPQDFEALLPFLRALEEELRMFLRQHAEERSYTLVGPITVRFAPDEALPAGQLRIRTRVAPDPEEAPQGAQAVGSRDTRVYRMAPGGVLVVVQGVQQGARFCLRKNPTVVGRRPTCDVVIPDPGVSREHLRVERDEEGWRVVDSGSTNGTFINDRRATIHRLRHGDRIRIGSTVLEYREEEA